MAYGTNVRLPSDSKCLKRLWDISEENIDISFQQRYQDLRKLQSERAQLMNNFNERSFEPGRGTDESYNEQGLKVRDVVLRRFEGQPTKLHPKWDGPFIISDSDSREKGVFSLRTANGDALQMKVNGSRLKKFDGDADGFDFASQALHKRDEIS